MTLYLLGGICLGLAELAWFIALLLSFHGRDYKRGREEGFEAGFEAGRARADDWWVKAEYETMQEREKIRHQEGKP